MNKSSICTLNFLWWCGNGSHSLCTTMASDSMRNSYHAFTQNRIAARQPIHCRFLLFLNEASSFFLFAPFGDTTVDQIGSFRPVPNHNYIRTTHVPVISRALTPAPRARHIFPSASPRPRCRAVKPSAITSHQAVAPPPDLPQLTASSNFLPAQGRPQLRPRCVANFVGTMNATPGCGRSAATTSTAKNSPSPAATAPQPSPAASWCGCSTAWRDRRP